jgi:type II secretion system protein N
MQVFKYVGYSLFFVVSLIFGLYYTFPWDAAKDRVLDLASRASGMTITASELQPSWITGIVAKDVKISMPGAKDPISIERLKARAKVFALITGKKGFSAELPMAKGDIDADVVLTDEIADIKGEAKNVELGLVPGLADAIGIPLTGTTSLKTDMKLGLKEPKETNGNLGLKMSGLKIEKGGKVAGFPIPIELAIGDIDWQIPVESGKATLKQLKASGDSVEFVIDGTIGLLNPIGRSNANLTISFKPSDKLLKSEPLLGALLNNIASAKGGDGFYTYAMSGTFKAPHFMPKRR